MPDSSSATQRGTASKTSPKPAKVHLGPTTVSSKTQYLVLYNLISLVLWVAVLLYAALGVITKSGWGLVQALGLQNETSTSTGSTASKVLANVYPSTFHVLTIAQTLALLEIIHAALGLVRTSVVTTSMQVASRLLLVWGILSPFGSNLLVEGTVRKVANVTGIASLLGRWGVGKQLGLNEPVQWNQVAYTGLLLAWTTTECIRYLYFVFFVGSEGAPDGVPKLLVWLRYNTFFALYPLGISSECWLIYHAIPFANQMDERLAWFLWAVLAIYVPGSYILYTHMMAQRRRIIKGKQKSRTE